MRDLINRDTTLYYEVIQLARSKISGCLWVAAPVVEVYSNPKPSKSSAFAFSVSVPLTAVWN